MKPNRLQYLRKRVPHVKSRVRVNLNRFCPLPSRTFCNLSLFRHSDRSVILYEVPQILSWRWDRHIRPGGGTGPLRPSQDVTDTLFCIFGFLLLPLGLPLPSRHGGNFIPGTPRRHLLTLYNFNAPSCYPSQTSS